MLLEINDLAKTYVQGGGMFGKKSNVRAVNGVSFSIESGQTFALVGESGCGKSTIAKMILLLETPSAGTMLFDGMDLMDMNASELKNFRRQTQAVFQDPYASLNPRHKTSLLIAEPVMAHEHRTKRELRMRVEELLDIVGLPASAADLYPHEFSGGQRQRIAIARALALNPRFLVLDEPISALDVSIRSQVLNLLSDIQERFSLTYLIIAHDLALVEHFSSQVGVMYLGEMVETGPTERVFGNPSHPYTQALLASVPRPDPDHRLPLDAIRGEIPSPMNLPTGCKFHTRCSQVFDRCYSEQPARYIIGEGHAVTCHQMEATS